MRKVEPEIYRVDVYRSDGTGDVIREIWFDEATGKVHRTNGPADIEFFEFEGRWRRSETYYRQGEITRGNDLPALVIIDVETETATLQRWYESGELSRSGDKPALVVTNLETGIVGREEYWTNGKMHRDDGPASIVRHETTGEVFRTAHFHHGVGKDGQKVPPIPEI